MDSRPLPAHRHTIVLSDGVNTPGRGGHRSQRVPLPPAIPLAAVVPTFVHHITEPPADKDLAPARKCTCGEHSASSLEHYNFDTTSNTTCGCSTADPMHRSFSTVDSMADSGVATPPTLPMTRKKVDPLSLSEDDEDEEEPTAAQAAEHDAPDTPRSDGGTEIIVVSQQ